MKSLNNNLQFWKYLTNFWSFITLLFFIAAYLSPDMINGVLPSVSVIYASILAIYVGSKEVTRWRSEKYISKYFGEIFVLVWTVVITVFILISAINPSYKMPPEFTATYITIMGIFAISQKSKQLKQGKK